MKNFSAASKIWVYPITATLETAQRGLVEQRLNEFLSQWKAHGVPVSGAFQIVDNRFVVLSADSNCASASGCSIDSMLKAVVEALKSADTELADFANVYYRENGTIQEVSRMEFADLKSSGKITAQTEVFDLTPANLGVFLSRGLALPFKDSWHAKYFP